MALEDTLAQYCTRAASARRSGDDLLATYWTEAAQTCADRIALRDHQTAHRQEWDVLKGSPEHG